MQHTDLTSERWSKLSLAEQMANIGSEVERAIKWQKKQNFEYAGLANQRALELFDLTKSTVRRASAIKEVARARELWLDFFVGENQYQQTADQWRKYFLAFNTAANLFGRERRDSNPQPLP